ncbi:MAG: 4-hydroxybenzoate octaprenyltransferase [Hyphomicrobiaceae bacterium]
MTSPSNTPLMIADAPRDNWVDRCAPPLVRPYLKLARADRPIGSWLLLFPCWWAQSLAELEAGHRLPGLWYLTLFLIGAFVMRGAGCTWNDIVDRHIDGRVERTALRPIPSGQVTVSQALAFAIALSLIGFLVLIQFNYFTIGLGIASLGLIAVYPYSKRFTYWPQFILGLTFKWGALMGWAAIQSNVAAPALALYAGCVCWTIGYDTIYAHQDKDDDAILGLKSTALRFGDSTRQWLTIFYGVAVALWALAVALVGVGAFLILSLVAIAVHLAWQVHTLDANDPHNCLKRFRSNRIVGWMFFLGIVAEMTLPSI